MVYRGPSKGCKTCRTRHVKCDETHPACNNCTGRNVTCPGFPSHFRPGETIIDETRAVVQASQKKTPSQLSRGLSEQDVFVSICFFFNNYAFLNKGIQSTRSELEYLPRIYSRTAPDSVVSASITALTLSFLSMWRGDGPDSAQSQRHANRAISSLRNDLNDPVHSQSDETLLAIMMLQFRETILGANKVKAGEDHHQRGAYAIIKHRGKQNFNSRLSKRLVQSLRSSLVFEALRTRHRADTALTIFQVTEDMPDDPNDLLAWAGVNVANLQAQFEKFVSELCSQKGRSPPGPTIDDLEVIDCFRREAASLEQDLIQWEESLPSSWRPISLSATEIPFSVRKARTYDNLCHVYPSISISGIWHTYRLERLILLRIMISCDRAIRAWRPLFRLDLPETSSTTTVSGRQEKNLQQLVDDLCASVPFHLGSRTDAGSIDEFGDTAKVDFPWPTPDKDPWTTIALLSASERKREALALGGWLLLGPLGATLQLLAGALDLWQMDKNNTSSATMLGSLLREGQMGWMVQQLQRVLVVQKMIRKGSPIPMVR